MRTDAPAYLRSAISRPQYASHLLARRFLESIDNDFRIPKTKDAHIEVPRHLRWSDDSVLAAIASQLDDLRNKRTLADYEMNEPKVERQAAAEDALDDADDIIDALDGCVDAGRRAEIVKAIRHKRLAIRSAGQSGPAA